jgi:hypothetical protein
MIKAERLFAKVAPLGAGLLGFDALSLITLYDTIPTTIELQYGVFGVAVAIPTLSAFLFIAAGASSRNAVPSTGLLISIGNTGTICWLLALFASLSWWLAGVFAIGIVLACLCLFKYLLVDSNAG